jgi:hypothetical protein
VELATDARVEILERGQSRKGDLGLGSQLITSFFFFFQARENGMVLSIVSSLILINFK